MPIIPENVKHKHSQNAYLPAKCISCDYIMKWTGDKIELKGVC